MPCEKVRERFILAPVGPLGTTRRMSGPRLFCFCKLARWLLVPAVERQLLGAVPERRSGDACPSSTSAAPLGRLLAGTDPRPALASVVRDGELGSMRRNSASDVGPGTITAPGAASSPCTPASATQGEGRGNPARQ